jgi:hypothetical protein
MIIIITTTMFRIFLILISMGMNVFTSHRATPAIINTIKTVNSGIIFIFLVRIKVSLPQIFSVT